MNRVTILTTEEGAEGFEDFELNGTVFEFRKLTADGPTVLIDGAAWVFVDWVMEDLSGLEMCRRLRADARTRNAHLTIVLELDDPEDRRRALKAGADDYMIGPAGRQSILDRILALHPSAGRRGSSQVIEAGDLKIDVGAEQVRWNGKPVTLRPNEFRLLRFLAENPNRVLSRRELIDALGKAGDPEYLRTVDVWIKRLRFGLRQAGAGQVLRTVHNKGYVLDVN
jgi:two-component system phosphate regulon response regulator PhoB